MLATVAQWRLAEAAMLSPAMRSDSAAVAMGMQHGTHPAGPAVARAAGAAMMGLGIALFL